jgi:hypothetical protein
MNPTTTKYEISKVKKLIDINGDIVNFKTRFRVESPTGNPVDVLVVSQSVLDTTDSSQLEYKTVVDKLEGEIVMDKNVYQNYFLILKANAPTEVLVTLDTQAIEIPAQKVSTTPPSVSNSEEIKIDYVLYCIIFLVILFFIYQLYASSSGNRGNTKLSLLDRLRDISQSHRN